jgi:hypothetical protein
VDPRDDMEKRKFLTLRGGLEFRLFDRPAVASRYTDSAMRISDLRTFEMHTYGAPRCGPGLRIVVLRHIKKVTNFPVLGDSLEHADFFFSSIT